MGCIFTVLKQTIMTTQTIQTSQGSLTYPTKVGRSEGIVVAKLWQSGDKCRVYFTVVFNGSKADCGFYDLSYRKSFLKSSPVNIARQLESELIIN